MKHKQKKWRDLSNIQKYFSCQCFLRCQRLAQRFKLNFPKLSWIFKLLQNTVSRNPQPPYNVPCKASFHFPVECGSCFCMTWRNGFGLRMPIMEEEHARRKHILRTKFTCNCFFNSIYYGLYTARTYLLEEVWYMGKSYSNESENVYFWLSIYHCVEI